MADDPFVYLFAEAGPIAPSQLARINSTPFLQDTTLPSPPPSPPPPPPAASDVPTLNCALAQAQTELEPGPEPETEPIHGLGFDKQAPPPPPPPLEMADVGGDDVVKVPDAKKGSGSKRAPAPKPKPAPAPKAAALDPLVQAVSVMAAKLDPNLEHMDILDICARKGIDFAPPRWHRPGGYEKKKDQE